jgi:Family of unknown function (DUF6604)
MHLAATAKQAKKTAVDVYEMERNVEEELQFRVFCFFEDFHRIQSFLGQIWQQFSDANIDLVTASLVTKVTLNLVKDLEDNIKNLSPKLNKDQSYCAIV